MDALSSGAVSGAVSGKCNPGNATGGEMQPVGVDKKNFLWYTLKDLINKRRR